MGLFCTVAGTDRRHVDAARPAPTRTFGNGGAPCQLGFIDPEAGTSFAFLTNGYPLVGYDYSPSGHQPHREHRQPRQRPRRRAVTPIGQMCRKV